MGKFSDMIKRNNQYGWLILQSVLLFMSVITCIVHNLNLSTGIIFYIFQLFGIYLPGLALCMLLKIECRNNLELCTWSYAFGVIILIFEYFLVVTFGVLKFIPVLSVLVTGGSLFVIWKNQHGIQMNNEKDDWIFCTIIMLIVMGIGLFTVSFANSLPNETGGTGYDVDWLYWVGNTISLSKGFPAQDFRLVGEPFNYHYFSNIIIAAIHLITKIDITILSFYYSFIIAGLLMIFSGYLLFSVLLSKKMYRYLALVLLLFTEGSTIAYMAHIYFCPFGYDYGYAFGMLAVYLLLRMIRTEAYPLKDVVLSSVLIGITTGCKGPIGIVILIGFGAVSLSLLLGKKWKQGFAYGVFWLGAFLFVYLFFISGPATAQNASAGLKFLGIKAAWQQNRWAQDIYSTLLTRYGIGENYLFKFVSLWLYNYRANRSAIVLLIIGSIWWICCWIKKKEITVSSVLIAISFWGIFLTNITNQSGGSQMYFIMSVLPYSILAGLFAMENISEHRRLVFELAKCSVIIAAFSGIATCLGEDVLPKTIQGLKCITKRLESEAYPLYYASEEDYEVYEWIKCNLPENAYIVWDSFVDSEERIINQVAGVFTEKYIWNDGKYSANEVEVARRQKMVDQFFAGDIKMLKELYKEGVRYAVQTVDINPDIQIDKAYLDCVYTNESFNIYKIVF